VWREKGGGLAFSVVVGHGPHRCFKVCGRLLLDLIGMVVDLEPVETRHKLVGRSLGPILRMHHEQHVREACAEVGPVSVVVSRRLWCVDVHAFGAVQLNHGFARDVAETNGKHGLVFAIDARAVGKVTRLILFDHLGDSSVSEDVSGVYESVKHFSCLLDEVAPVGIVLEVIVRLQVQDHVQGLAVVGDLLVQSRQIKLVLNVILIDLAEELVPTEPAEPRNP